MQLGVLMFPTDKSMRPDDLARAAEERGFESLWFPEHTHIPTGRATPFPGGTELPDWYRRTIDPFVALGAAAAVTERIKVATGICLVAQRDPIVLAKEVASLDYVSRGRFVFGVGVGWNVDEMEQHGVDPKRRRALVREKVLAMKALWTQDEAAFDGEFVRFAPSWSWPKPVQQPHPKVVMGGAPGPITFRHIVEWCDGWMPIMGRGSDLAEGIETLRRTAQEAGRDPETIEIGVFGVPGKVEVLEQLEALGVVRAVLGVPNEGGAEAVLPVLDRYLPLLERWPDRG